MKLLSIKSIKSLGIQNALDFEVNHKDHNFYAEGIVTSNSHSVSYGSLCAAMTYVKFKYPTQFYLSLLKMTKNEPDDLIQISKIHKEMVNFGIKLLPPSIIKSKNEFSIEGNDIRFGLSSIKGISGKTMEKLNNFKREYANKFELFQCAKEAGLSISVLCALIMAGALPDFNTTRSFLVYESQLWNCLVDKEKILCMNLGKNYDYKLVPTLRELFTLKNEKGKPLLRESREETIKKKSEKYKEIYNKNRIHEGFCNYWYEKRMIGFTYFTTLKNIFDKYEENLQTISELKNHGIPDSKCKVVGIIEESKTGTSKNNNKYLKCILSDEGSQINAMIFTDNLIACKEINGRLPKKDDVVIVEGLIKNGDVIFANKISIQQNKIYIDFKDDNKNESNL
jgi:DNA polymerase III alpha subunit